MTPPGRMHPSNRKVMTFACAPVTGHPLALSLSVIPTWFPNPWSRHRPRQSHNACRLNPCCSALHWPMHYSISIKQRVNRRVAKNSTNFSMCSAARSMTPSLPQGTLILLAVPPTTNACLNDAQEVKSYLQTTGLDVGKISAVGKCASATPNPTACSVAGMTRCHTGLLSVRSSYAAPKAAALAATPAVKVRTKAAVNVKPKAGE